MGYLFRLLVLFKSKISKCIYLYYLMYSKPQIKLGKNVVFNKKPILCIFKSASLIIEDNVTLNSNNIGYHVNMFAPCKIMADKEGAEIHIGSNTRIHGSCIHAENKIYIGKNCLIAANCQIMDCHGHKVNMTNPEKRLIERDTPKTVVIEDNVWLGTGVIVLPGVRIGEGSIVSANSVVCNDIPSKVIVRGNPAKPV